MAAVGCASGFGPAGAFCQQLLPPVGAGLYTLKWDTAYADPYGVAAGSPSDRLIVKNSGYYFIQHWMGVDYGRSRSAGQVYSEALWYCFFYLNGSTLIGGNPSYLTDGPNTPNTLLIPGNFVNSPVFHANAGDYVQIQGYMFSQNSTALASNVNNSVTAIPTVHDVSTNSYQWRAGDIIWIMDGATPEACFISSLSANNINVVARGAGGGGAAASHTADGALSICRGYPWHGGYHGGWGDTLNGNMSSNTTALAATSNNSLGFADNDYLQCGTEIMLVTGNGFGYTVTRGALGTTATTHSTNDKVWSGRLLGGAYPWMSLFQVG